MIYIDGPRLRAQQNRRLRKRQEASNSISMDSSSGIDSRGPWFDGVEALQSSGISAVDVDAAKSKHIAIVGAGMAGLMSWLVLHEAGFTNITILESSQELGGRVQPQYFGDPSARQYQEMGPMRFPQAIQYAESNETVPIKDHLIVTDLVAELNRRNKQNPDYNISMIPFINNSPNGIVYANRIRLPNGDLPTIADTEADSSLIPQPASPPKVAEISQVLNSFLSNQTFMALLSRNIFAAYKEWQLYGLHGLGGDSFSEFSYVHNYLNYSLESTFIASTAPGFGGWPFWDRLYETFYFGATDWNTIEGGMQKLPNAFHPLVDQHTTFNAKVDGISYNISTRKVNITHQSPLNYHLSSTSSIYDLAILTPPLPMIRSWTLPSFSPLLSAAISSYTYSHGCKCALQFHTRFWEHLPNRPIYGSCSTTTSTPRIGQICYPSYDINTTSPGVVLASYIAGSDAVRWLGVSPDEYITYTLNAFAQIHGDIVHEQFTGNGSVKCWLTDPNEYAGWAEPEAGTRQAFGPSFFKTEQGCVLAGEATSFTSSWIASALESGVRAGVQVMLGEGLVDEAKMVVENWMGRFIEV